MSLVSKDLTVLDLDGMLPTDAFSDEKEVLRVLVGSEALRTVPSQFRACLVLADASSPATLRRLDAFRSDVKDRRTQTAFVLVERGKRWSAEALRTVTSLSMLALGIDPEFENMTLTYSAPRTLVGDRKLVDLISTRPGLVNLWTSIWTQTHLDIVGWHQRSLSPYETKWSLRHALPPGRANDSTFSWTPNVLKAQGEATVRAHPLSAALRYLRPGTDNDSLDVLCPKMFPADQPIVGSGSMVTVLSGWYILRLLGEWAPVAQPEQLLHAVLLRAGNESTSAERLNAIAAISEDEAIKAVINRGDPTGVAIQLFELGREVPRSFDHLLSNLDDKNATLLHRIELAMEQAGAWRFTRNPLSQW